MPRNNVGRNSISVASNSSGARSRGGVGALATWVLLTAAHPPPTRLRGRRSGRGGAGRHERFQRDHFGFRVFRRGSGSGLLPRPRRSPVFACRGILQFLNHLPATAEALLGRLRQGTRYDRLVAGRQAVQPRPAVQVLGRQLRRRAAVVWQCPREHLLVDDRQAVLVAMDARAAVEELRRGIDRRHAADDRAVNVLQVLDQAEVGDLDPSANQKQVLRFDVQMLQTGTCWLM